MKSPSPSNRLWLVSYTLLYGILAILALAALWQGYQRSVFVDESFKSHPAPEESAMLPTGNLIDPNTAEWQDLSLLPGMGKKVSQEIVAYRQTRQTQWLRAHPDQSAEEAPPVFTKPEDLLAIKGIGKKTLEKIRPYLRIATAEAATSPMKSETSGATEVSE